MSLSCGTLLQQPQGANAPGFTSSLFPQMPLLSGNTWPQCLQVKIGRHSKSPHVTTGHQQMLEIGALSSSGGWPSATRTTQRAPEAQGPGSDSDTNPYVSPPPTPTAPMLSAWRLHWTTQRCACPCPLPTRFRHQGQVQVVTGVSDQLAIDQRF